MKLNLLVDLMMVLLLVIQEETKDTFDYRVYYNDECGLKNTGVILQAHNCIFLKLNISIIFIYFFVNYSFFVLIILFSYFIMIIHLFYLFYF